jgi:TIR domain
MVIDEMPSIFISYRRGISSGWAGRLSQALTSEFGNGSVYMDIEALSPGVDFINALDDALKSCDCFLSIIAPDWLGIADHTGRRRLDDPSDFVRLELATALKREIRVIPVLVGGALMPKAEELPEALVRLARRQAHELSDARWGYDCRNLLLAIKGTTPAREVSRRRKLIALMALTTLSATGLAFLGYWYIPRSTPFTIIADRDWQDTGFSVRQGEQLTITYKGGTWRGTLDGQLVNPNTIVSATHKTANCFPVEETQVGPGAVVAQIGGHGLPFDAFRSHGIGVGQVYLKMNDCKEYIGDNSGAVEVLVKASRW